MTYRPNRVTSDDKKRDKTNDYREAAARFQGKSKLVNMMFFSQI